MSVWNDPRPVVDAVDELLAAASNELTFDELHSMVEDEEGPSWLDLFNRMGAAEVEKYIFALQDAALPIQHYYHPDVNTCPF